jgi:hypothetical protein
MVFGARLSGTKSEAAAVAMTARVTSRLVIIKRNRSVCSALKAMLSGVTGSSAKTRPKRSGCLSSMRAAMMPPVEWVARWQKGMRNSSRAASMSRACWHIE